MVIRNSNIGGCMRKVKFYCDHCKKEFKASELTVIEITFGATKGVEAREVCHGCWSIYTNRIAEVAKEMFEE